MSEFDYDNIKHFQSILSNTSPNESHNWDLHENNMWKLINQYETFTKDSGEKSAQFAFWHVFLNDVVSVLIDLVRLHREADCDLHLSATRRAVPLFFFFNRTNCKRWVPFYFEGCMGMKSKLPELWGHFSEGKFVVHQQNEEEVVYGWIKLWRSSTWNQQRVLQELSDLQDTKKLFANGI